MSAFFSRGFAALRSAGVARSVLGTSSRSTTFSRAAAAGGLGLGLAGVGALATAGTTVALADDEVDYGAVYESIVDIMEDENWDDGSWGPVFVRLAWHAAGTYDKNTKTGGSDGATMRFKPESDWGANAGLHLARAKLEIVKAKHPNISYADLWSFAGTVAIVEMGGPETLINLSNWSGWRPGRVDSLDGKPALPDGRLPDADGRDKTDAPADHLRDIFYRMGFNDKEIVCLSGAHALGRCHTDRSGFSGPWTRAPTTFSTEYFRLLLEEKWTPKKWNGPFQYEDPSGDLMMLPTDLAIVQDAKMKPHVEHYVKNPEAFEKDFHKAWIKLQELGVEHIPLRPRKYIFFGPRE